MVMTPATTERPSTLFELRDRTDVRLDPRWILAAISAYAFWILFALSLALGFSIPPLDMVQTLGLIGLLGIASSGGISYAVYGLLSRQNKHGERQEAILAEIVRAIRTQESSDNIVVQLPLSSVEQDQHILLEKTHEHSAILWSALVLIPYLGWLFLMIALYLLTRTSNLHDRIEKQLFEDVDRTLVASGFKSFNQVGRVPSSRNSGAYLAASLATLGVIALAWLYVLIIGEDAHYYYHSNIESELATSLQYSTIGYRRAP